eukprot:11677312-Alexandrium_andersonii.AAC.1
MPEMKLFRTDQVVEVATAEAAKLLKVCSHAVSLLRRSHFSRCFGLTTLKHAYLEGRAEDPTLGMLATCLHIRLLKLRAL